MALKEKLGSVRIYILLTIIIAYAVITELIRQKITRLLKD